MDRYSHRQERVRTSTPKDICPAALGSKDQQPAAYFAAHGLFYVPTNHVCMDYEPYQVEYVAGQPYVGAVLTMFPRRTATAACRQLHRLGRRAGKIVWSNSERFSVWSGALATAGDVVFYGTLEGI